MRLHHLRLRALGPFATEQVIDFEHLGAGGLFLLDGPTGAGKSTVLDAITFALYGPGERGGDGRLHSQFAAVGVAPEVVLEFSVAGVRQRITRSPEHSRPKRRGEGSTLESARVHLERNEGGEWVSRSSNKAEVGDLIADDIGLSREQFTQVVLLPQGEFMKFLRASDDDRRVLLTRLFGTQLYDRITDELERRRRSADAELVVSERRLQARVSAAGEAAGLDAAAQDELAALTASQRGERFDQLAAALAVAAGEAAAASGQAADEVTQCLARARRADANAELASRFAAAVRAAAEHEATRAEHDRAAVVVAAAERAEPVRPLLHVLDDAEVELRATLAALPAGAPASWRSGQGADELVAAATAAGRQAAELGPLVQREREALTLRAQLVAAERGVTEAAALLGALEQRRLELPGQLSAAEAAIQEALVGAAARPAIDTERAALRRRAAAAGELAELQPERAAAQSAREAAFVAYEAAASEHLRLVAERLANMAGELAAALVPGEACAVCGSHEHPAPAAHADDAVGAPAVAAAQHRAAEAERRYQSAVAAAAECDQRGMALQAVADGADPAALDVALRQLDAALDRALAFEAALPSLTGRRDALAAEAAQLATDQQAAAAARATAVARAEALGAQAAALAGELAAAQGGFASVAARVG
ncbi:SMC family ATPase, partial [Jatrophihabitans sp.]|uniref:SMC family ATPase n=1 Tax=Jatrophihabitans sp. TaxID=1932789 RepID=UPI0030C6822F|nr:putative exonuclease [Jatrophihabitans sp.]